MIKTNCLESLIINVLKRGYIPNHIAFIMDGNRRHAKKNDLQLFKGHQDGAQSLKKCLLYCLQLGVKIASFYCFSIQNFNRSQEQVSKLMELAIKTFDQLSDISQLVQKKNVKVKVIGNTSLIRQDVRKALYKVVEKTQFNNQMTVNLCFAYDSLDQIKRAKQKTIQLKQPLTKQNTQKNLDIPHQVDILVRTSNQSRLSNFMLMQNQYSKIVILKQNWPQISVLSFVRILLDYNYHYKSICSMRQKVQSHASEQEESLLKQT